MPDVKKSPIQISEFLLTDLTFKTKSSKLKSVEVPAESIKISVTVQELTNLSFMSFCKIALFENESEADFEFSGVYQITSSVSEESQKANLEGFARIGAPFNAFVHLRDLLINLSARAFGKSILLPLLDISTEFTKIATVKSVPIQVEDPNATPEKETSSTKDGK